MRIAEQNETPTRAPTQRRHGAFEASSSHPHDAMAANSEQKSYMMKYRSRCKPTTARPFEKGVQEAAPPPPQLQEACQLDYDTARYPFAELVAEALGLSDPAALATLHETSDGRKAQANPPRAGQCAFRRRWRTWLDKEPGARARLNAMFRAFVEEEVVRHFGEPAIYQADPTLRVHIAGTGRALGVPHVDADYFHQPAELNYWLPLTPCWGANTLWCESRRGAADYAPFTLQGAGRYQRFWGNQLRHFTLPNDTGSTRVSFDLRCVPLSLFVHDWKAPKGNVPFALGFYYCSTAEGTAAQGAEARLAARVAARAAAEAAEAGGGAGGGVGGEVCGVGEVGERTQENHEGGQGGDRGGSDKGGGGRGGPVWSFDMATGEPKE